MSDGILSRLLNLVRGAGETFVKDLERDNPEAVFQASIEAHTQRYHEAQTAANALASRKERLIAERDRLQREAVSLGQQATQAAGVDDAKALQLIEQRDAATAHVAEIEGDLPEIERLLKETRETLPVLKDQIAHLKAERDAAMAQMRAAEGKIQQDDAAIGASSQASDRALQTVRDRLDRMTGGSSPSSSAAQTPAVSSKEAARQKAVAELEALKKAKAEAGGAAKPAAAVKPAAGSRAAAPTGSEADAAAGGATVAGADAEGDDEDATPELEPGPSRRTL